MVYVRIGVVLEIKGEESSVFNTGWDGFSKVFLDEGICELSYN